MGERNFGCRVNMPVPASVAIVFEMLKEKGNSAAEFTDQFLLDKLLDVKLCIDWKHCH